MEENLKVKIAILEKRVIALEEMIRLLTGCVSKNADSITTLANAITQNSESIINVIEHE